MLSNSSATNLATTASKHEDKPGPLAAAYKEENQGTCSKRKNLQNFHFVRFFSDSYLDYVTFILIQIFYKHTETKVKKPLHSIRVLLSLSHKSGNVF